MSTPTAESTITLLSEILEELNKEENVTKLEEARSNIGNEMLKMMQFLFPMIMEIQMEVIKKHGYSEGRDGITQFSQTVRQFERDDPEVARLNNLIRAYYLPSVAAATTAECQYEVPTET